MTAAARSAERSPQRPSFPTPTAPDEPPQPSGPNDYGGRVSPQPELPNGFARDEILIWTNKQRRRRKARATLVELNVMRATLGEGCNWRSGRCDLSLEGLRARAGCSRSQLFRTLDRLEELGIFEPRQKVRQCFKICRHTILKGWRGFRACHRLRKAQARAQGRTRASGCVAHHGRVTIRWFASNVEEVEKAFGTAPLKVPRKRAYGTTTRKPRNGSKRRVEAPAASTANGTADENPYGTPHPGSPSPKTANKPTLTLRTTVRSGARAERANNTRESTAPAARRARLDAQTSHGLDARASRDSLPRAFDGFPGTPPREASTAPPPATPPAEVSACDLAPESESTGGTRAPAMPPESLASNIDAVLAEDRAQSGTTLARDPGTPYERRALGALILAGGWSGAELCEVVRGLPLLRFDHGRSIRSWVGSEARMQRAIEALRARAAREARKERSKLAPRPTNAPLSPLPPPIDPAVRNAHQVAIERGDWGAAMALSEAAVQRELEARAALAGVELEALPSDVGEVPILTIQALIDERKRDQ